MATQLFRKEVIEAGRDRLAGTVVAATPPRGRLYVALVLAVAAIFIAFLVFGQYASRAQVRGVVAFDSGIARVYPSAQGEVRAIHVRTGMRVAAGDPLVTLALAQGAGGVGGQLSEVAVQDAELARQEQLASMLGSSETQALHAQRSNLSAGIASLERQRTIAAGQIGLAEAAARRAAQLAREGAGTQRQVEDGRAALLARRAELESLTERLIAQRDALSQVEARIAQRAIEADRSRSEIVARRAALAEQGEALKRTDRLVLTAPVAGEVGDVATEIGLRARPDTSLVTIVPQGSSLEVWLYAPSRAVGFVRPGQQVRLNFDAFPYQRFGMGRGTVTAVSRVPVEASAIDSDLGISEPVFRIRVRLDRMPPRAAQGRLLRPGMTLSANLVLERRSFWEIIFNPAVMAAAS
ncbi:MAG TPA: HlyD family efflux transporter periplasmic adaptor subunit [Allosphingosinicella sp.]|nr:HlyD family efflux transporter periplasmic adaptor subunit [Allosphingosinicella sp.]